MIYLGKLLTEEDLKVFIYDSSNNVLIDPYSIFYTIFDCTTGKQEIIRQTINSKPMKFNTGSYFVPLKLDPKIFRVGRHLIRWQIQKYFDTSIQQAAEKFDIVRSPFYSGDFCKSTYPVSTAAYK